MTPLLFFAFIVGAALVIWGLSVLNEKPPTPAEPWKLPPLPPEPPPKPPGPEQPPPTLAQALVEELEAEEQTVLAYVRRKVTLNAELEQHTIGKKTARQLLEEVLDARMERTVAPPSFKPFGKKLRGYSDPTERKNRADGAKPVL